MKTDSISVPRLIIPLCQRAKIREIIIWPVCVRIISAVLNFLRPPPARSSNEKSLAGRFNCTLPTTVAPLSVYRLFQQSAIIINNRVDRGHRASVANVSKFSRKNKRKMHSLRFFTTRKNRTQRSVLRTTNFGHRFPSLQNRVHQSY